MGAALLLPSQKLLCEQGAQQCFGFWHVALLTQFTCCNPLLFPLLLLLWRLWQHRGRGRAKQDLGNGATLCRLALCSFPRLCCETSRILAGVRAPSHIHQPGLIRRQLF